MNNRWWTIALMLIVIGCVVFWQGEPIAQSPSAPPLITEVATSPPSPPLLVPPINVPQVDRQQLITNLQALITDRHTIDGRDRTRTYLVNQLNNMGWSAITQPFPGGANVIAHQPGNPSPSGTILVIAHFDAVVDSPGADDNATGVVAALEVARLLKDRASRYSLAIALFDQEENGLIGSLAFTRNPDNLNNLIGVINLEMLGYTCHTVGCQTVPDNLPIQPPSDRGDFLGIVGDQEHPYLLQAFELAHNQHLPPIITIPIPFKGILTPDVLRSDHAPFWAKNIGAVMISDTANFRNPHYHQPSDTIDTLDLTFFTQATQLVVNAVTVLLGT